MTERDEVDICLENLRLGVMALHLPGRILLAQLPIEAQVPPVDDVGMHVADELLGDRARTAHPPADKPVLQGADHPNDVHPVVLVESAVLDCDERQRDIWGERGERHARPDLPTDFPDERTIAPVHECRLRHVDDPPGIASEGRGRRCVGRAG